MANTITTNEQLEALLGEPFLGVKMKVIDHLDSRARDWCAATTLAFIAIAGPQGPRITVAGGSPGFMAAVDAKTLKLPLAALDDAALPQLQAGAGAGMLCLAPGIGETLRANGRVKAVTAEYVELAIEECFIHCAKALIRSAFWKSGPDITPAEPAAFINSARFLALATQDARGLIDISPKGDPAGLLVRMVEGRAVLAERPGNRLAFGYRNIIEQPRVAACAINPGAAFVALIEGRAHLSTDGSTLQSFTVAGKTPVLATVIEDVSAMVHPSPALQRAAAWSGMHADAQIDPVATLVAHVKLNKEQGVEATLLRLSLNRNLVGATLKSDYAKKLY